MIVKVLQGPVADCEVYVRTKKESRFCHLPSWSELVLSVFGHKVYYLAAYQESQVVGILPLTYIKSFLFGRRLISQGFSNYGGFLCDMPDARDALYEKATELAIDFKCPLIEFRSTEPLSYELSLQSDKVTFHLPLTSDPEDLWKSFDPKVRNQVRKAMKSGIVSASGKEEYLDMFFDIYAIRMKQLGTPPYSKKLMRQILQRYPQNTRIFIVSLQDKPIGGGFTISYNGMVEILWAATLVQYNTFCPNNLLYWSAMEFYCAQGANTFDFGRCTKEGSTFRFKKQWGSKMVPLYYYYWVHPGSKLSLLRPDNVKYSKKVDLWKKLPLPITRFLGPLISRNLG